MFVIAGPGTGKTTALALRILKLIYVDGLDPASILATTFTKKAAGELRSRILGWGDQLRRAFLQGATPAVTERLQRLDLNRVVTGTLDSLVEDVLTQWRVPGQQPPVVLEPFVAESRMLRALWSNARHRNTDLAAYATHLVGGAVRGFKGLARLCDEVRGRYLHDQVDVPQYLAQTIPQHPGAGVLDAVVRQYDQDLQTGLVVDFPALENRFLTDLAAGLLDAFANQIRVVLVDEYQDTNLLQEQIYLELTGYAINNGGSVVVVGDDDQSLYRFRGATVELFVAFPVRVQQRFGFAPATVSLRNNYRSTPNLVAYFSDFANLDPAYAPARVVGKLPLVPSRGGAVVNFPVLGMFRPTADDLARDLARFVGDVFSGAGVTINTPTGALQIIRDPADGAVGDCALLCSSPAEYSSGDRARLPLLVRRELAALPTAIEVFNPRGQAFAEIPAVAQLGGLLLECMDPPGRAAQVP
jgi:DNA helicase-2/ATP-dependent DNA helicase PcrA